MESKMIRRGGGIQTSVIVSADFYNLCKQHGIRFSEALGAGISVLLAEKGIMDYDNKLNLFRKMKIYQQELETATIKLAELQEKYGN